MKIDLETKEKKMFLNIKEGEIFKADGREGIFIKTDELYISEDDLHYNAVDLLDGVHESFRDTHEVYLIEDYIFKIRNLIIN